MMSRKKSGHFCWCCGRSRPNERFSGRNHARHLCRDCARLPAEELQYRQAERDIERLLHDGVRIPRRKRPQFDRFLAHPNARVRELARRILAESEREAEEWRRMRDAEEAWATAPVTDPGEDDAGASDSGATVPEEGRDGELEDDVPF
jgi:hypothetical protein